MNQTIARTASWRRPRPLEEIEADIRGIEQDILRTQAEVTGGE